MTREQVFSLIRAHLSDELEVDPSSIQESTRFREDLEADSLDLYTLVQELEDSYGVKISDRGGREDPDRRPGGRLRARQRRCDRARRRPPRAKAPTLSELRGDSQAQRQRCCRLRRSLQALLDQLAAELATPVFTHSSWTLAARGLLRAARVPRATACWGSRSPRTCSRVWRRTASAPGRLTKIRAQAVSGRSCRAVAERLGVPERLRAAAPARRAVPGSMR